MNKYTLACHIGQKDESVLQLIHEALKIGNIRYDISWKGSIWTVSDRKGIHTILEHFTKHELFTVKNTDVVTFKSILQYLNKGDHLLQGPLKHNLDLLIKQFRNRNLASSS